MNSVIASPLAVEDKLGQAKPDMHVYDRLGRKVGKVDGIFAGGGDHGPEAPAVVPVAMPVPTQMPLIEPVTRSETVPEFDDVIEPGDDMPKEVRERLMHNGFIRVDAGFLKRHRYALREQIDKVEADRVVLNVVADDLFKH
jgi:hypothetical protein